jgi:predicted RNA-binding protein
MRTAVFEKKKSFVVKWRLGTDATKVEGLAKELDLKKAKVLLEKSSLIN